jgi:hypothetical protein
MEPADDSGKSRTQAIVNAALVAGTAALFGVAVFFLGEERVGIWYYPAIAAAIVVWLYGEAKLISTVMSLARDRRERDSDGDA